MEEIQFDLSEEKDFGCGESHDGRLKMSRSGIITELSVLSALGR